MNNNVHILPVRRKAGRPRLRPMPNTPTAGILAFPSGEPTLEQKLADYDAMFDQLRQCYFDMTRALASISSKYPRD